MGEMNIVERGLGAGHAQIGVELLDRLPIGRGVRRVNVALRLRMRPRSGDLNGHICRSGNRIVEARERRGRSDVYVVQVHVRGERSVFGELSFLQARRYVEVGAGITAPQRAAAKTQDHAKRVECWPQENPNAPAVRACAKLQAG